MGTEIVFVLIWLVLLICIPVGFWVWLRVAKLAGSTATARAKAYLPLVAGFAISATGLMLLGHISAAEDFTELVRQGFYTEAQRSFYLPGRALGQIVASAVVAVPIICLVVIPCTAKLVVADRLSWGAIGVRVAVAWLALALLGWFWSTESLDAAYSLADVLKSAAAPTLICGLPIPVATLVARRRLRGA